MLRTCRAVAIIVITPKVVGGDTVISFGGDSVTLVGVVGLSGEGDCHQLKRWEGGCLPIAVVQSMEMLTGRSPSGASPCHIWGSVGSGESVFLAHQWAADAIGQIGTRSTLWEEAFPMAVAQSMEMLDWKPAIGGQAPSHIWAVLAAENPSSLRISGQRTLLAKLERGQPCGGGFTPMAVAQSIKISTEEPLHFSLRTVATSSALTRCVCRQCR